MDRIEESVSRSAVNVMNSLKAGAFVLKDTELDIDRIRLEDGIYIKGFVDRVDEYVSDKYGRFLRIVDYKTGNTEFKKADIINGKNMQLMIYAIAAQLYYDREEDSDKAHSLSGIYYQHMRDRYMNGKTEDEAKSKLHDEMYFNGVTYLSEDEEKRTELVNAINETRESDSIYLPIRYVASGDVSPTSYDTETERDALIEKVKDNIVGIDKEIMCGMILPRPYSGGGALACEYCGYKDVCSFDNNKSIRFADKNGAGFGKEM
jgi:ATP-dependent helicase/nuclease subunit B